MNKRSEILRTAETLVNGDRNRQYGDPRSDFRKIASLWEVYLNGTHEKHMAQGLDADYIMIDEHDVAVLMILLKVSRISWSPEKEDSWADLAGYAACGWDCAAEEEEEEEDRLDDDDYDDSFQTDLGVDLTDDEAAEIYAMYVDMMTGDAKKKKNQGFLKASLLGFEDK